MHVREQAVSMIAKADAVDRVEILDRCVGSVDPDVELALEHGDELEQCDEAYWAYDLGESRI